MTSLSLVKATMEGVVRSPSEFSMTLAVLPSMTATHELVVPRSIPMILPMLSTPEFFKRPLGRNWYVRWGSACFISMPTRPQSPCHRCRQGAPFRRPRPPAQASLLGDRHQRGAQKPVVQHVALLEHVDDRVGGRTRGLHHAHGVVLFRIQRLT